MWQAQKTFILIHNILHNNGCNWVLDSVLCQELAFFYLSFFILSCELQAPLPDRVHWGVQKTTVGNLLVAQVHVSNTEQTKHLLDRKHLEIKFCLHLWQTGHKGLFNYFRNQKYLHQLVEIAVHLCRICTMNWKGKTSSELNLILLAGPTLPYWAKWKYLKIAKGSAGRRGRGTLKIKQQQDFLHWYPCVAANVNRNDFLPKDPRRGQTSG